MHIATKYEPLKSILTMASRLSVYDVLERLDDDDDGPYSEDESDCEAEGISGYMPEADDDLMAAIASEASLDNKKEEGTDDASSSELTTGLFAGQYLLPDTILSHS